MQALNNSHRNRNPKIDNNGKITRSNENTYLLAASADKPDGPYTKPLHRGHEAMLWKEKNGIGSMGLAYDPKCFYRSTDGLNFRAIHQLTPLKGAGIYRPDFTDKNHKGERPMWGIALGEIRDCVGLRLNGRNLLYNIPDMRKTQL